jgi:hypothetical protein
MNEWIKEAYQDYFHEDENDLSDEEKQAIILSCQEFDAQRPIITAWTIEEKCQSSPVEFCQIV